MRVISKKALVEFWTTHPNAQAPLDAWYRLFKKAEFANFAEVKQVFGSADRVPPDHLVFNIGGNKYRLVVSVGFQVQICWIKRVMTHEEYDRWKP